MTAVVATRAALDRAASARREREERERVRAEAERVVQLVELVEARWPPGRRVDGRWVPAVLHVDERDYPALLQALARRGRLTVDQHEWALLAGALDVDGLRPVRRFRVVVEPE
jgi:hypothetical protein